MPELPEVETLKRGLEETILGKTISQVAICLPKIIALGPRTVSNLRKINQKTLARFRAAVKGKRIVGIRRRAKMLILDLAKKISLPRHREGLRERSNHEQYGQPLSSSPLIRREGNMVLLIHLKLTGQLIYAKKGERKVMKIFNAPNSRQAELPHQYTHATFIFTDGSRLFFNDLRQFGYLKLVQDNELEKVKELRGYGPEPLGRDFTADYFEKQAKRRSRLTIKQFLMDPKVVAGIGNIYSDEILFCAKIRPQRPVRSLSNRDFQAIYRCTLKVLKEAIRARGSSVGDFFQIDGSEGQFGRAHKVYQRFGQKCKVCGKIVEKVKLGGRTSSYCPKCQE